MKKNVNEAVRFSRKIIVIEYKGGRRIKKEEEERCNLTNPNLNFKIDVPSIATWQSSF
jgi:hypothetical protein